MPAPFRFKPGHETVEAGFRRIACAQIDEVLALLRARELPPERIVHQVRRACKAMRGLFRLVRPAFPAFETENAAFRDLARSLAGSRDRKVLLDSFDQLVATRRDKAGVAALRQRLAGEEPGGPENRRAMLDHCAETLLAARVRAASWPFSASGWDAIGPGYRKTYRAARRARKAVTKTGDAHASHEWRKQAKYHWQHARLLRRLDPEGLGTREKQARRLADLLGDRHDLDILAEALAGLSPGGDPLVAALVASAQRRAAKIGERANRIGAELFAETSGKVARQLGQRWKDADRKTP